MNLENAKLWIEQNQNRFQGKVSFNESLKPFTYYRIGGPAEILINPKTRSDLLWISELCLQAQLPVTVLGAGSNVLISDEGLKGIVVRTAQLENGLLKETEGKVLIGAGFLIPRLLKSAIEYGWVGFERLAGVPGSIGGAVRMNAGTHLGETKDFIVSAQWFSLSTGKITTRELSERDFEYRKNLFLKDDDIVMSATFQIEKSDPKTVKTTIDATLERRLKTQPVDLPSCGSVFKNPKDLGLHSWEVMDGLGLRGYRLGDAQISEVHPNFIVNLGAAKASDVYSLIELVRTRAREDLGIDMVPEVKLLGSFSS